MVDATFDVLCRILSLLFPFELVVWEVVIFVDAHTLFICCVSLRHLCRFVFSACDASLKECTFLLCQESKCMADVFLGGSLFLVCSFRQRSIVVGKSF